MRQERHPTFIPLRRFILLDLLYDPVARHVLIYAAAHVLLGTLLYSWLEGWNWIDSLYFVVITLATIGYGDLAPTRPITRLITVFYAINGIAILLMLIDQIRRLRDPSKPK
ncbi:MAG TPA: potassium channel family protein [Methanothrix sp.]|nr:potassium channel family protein [Methanothrix sp.]